MPPENKVASENKIKNYARLVVDLLSPSAFGLIIYGVTFILTILLSQNSGAKKFISDINIGQLKSTFLGQYINDVTKILNLPFANTITIYIFWTVIATFIYFVGYRMYKNAHELTTDVKVRGYLRPAGTNKNKPVIEFIEKTSFRLFALIFLLIYVYRLIPFGINYIKNTDLNFTLSISYLELVIKFLIIEFLLLHFGVILVRLLLLRRRIIYSEKY